MEQTARRTFTLPSTLPDARGTWFVRACLALGAQESHFAAANLAESRWGKDNQAALLLKAAVAAGTTTDNTWAKPLAEPSLAENEIISLVRDASVTGQMPLMRRRPFNTSWPRQTANSAASWVAEGKAKPISKMAFTTEAAIEPRKLSSVVLLTKDVLVLSHLRAAAENMFREYLVDSLVTALDTAFLDPANAGVAGERPASITNGVAPIASAGTADGDAKALFAAYQGDWASAYLICRNAVGAGLAGPTRPNAGARGGSVSGVPLICSRHAPAGTLIMVDAAGIGFCESGIELDRTEHALVEMRDDPVTPPVAATVQHSAWALNYVALRIERYVNWRTIRPNSVSLVSGITW